jgi:hypothetical protein
MNKTHILKIIGIPDDNRAKVVYNDGFFQKFALFFDGNSSFLENITLQDTHITTLYIGGEKQFETIQLPKNPDVIITMICDPEIQKKALSILNSLDFKAPLLNPPSKIFNTARDTLSQNLPFDERFIIPKTYRVAPKNRSEILSYAQTFFGERAFLFRPVISHGGEGLVRVDDVAQEDFHAFVFNGENEYFITEFFDFHSTDGRYKKARFFVLDGKVYPRHYIISSDWKIHSHSRKELFNEAACKKEEENFLNNPPTLFLEFCSYIYEHLKLDFFGIDCAMLPDGKIVLFEANVCMRPFAKHTDAYLQQIENTLLEKFSSLLNTKTKP